MSVKNLCQYIMEVRGGNNCIFSLLDAFLVLNSSLDDVNVGNRPVIPEGP